LPVSWNKPVIYITEKRMEEEEEEPDMFIARSSSPEVRYHLSFYPPML
jgi:hypothetical protein